jgi:small subunit ribosomal protein S21
MIKIDVSKFKSLDQALKFYKQKRAKIGIDKELRARTEFVKPSVERRKEIQKAAYVQKTYKKS